MAGKTVVFSAILFSAGLCLAECPSADLNGDCIVNFLDFRIMALEPDSLDLKAIASQWLESDEEDFEPLIILGRIKRIPPEPEPDPFEVQFVVVDKHRVERSVFQYECQVILKNTSTNTFENVRLAIASWPDNMAIIDPRVDFGDTQIAPGASAPGIDTCTFRVDRSVPINPVEITCHNLTALGDMTLIPGGTFQMGDHFGVGQARELPVHLVHIDSFYMGRYEITNQQYCDFLNSSYSQGLITVMQDRVYRAGTGTSYPYCDTHTAVPDSQISYSEGLFTPIVRDKCSMADHPALLISWYGAAAYCNWRSLRDGKMPCYTYSTWDCYFSKNGYRLPTEAEWEYAARGSCHDPYYKYPWCSNSIDCSKANCEVVPGGCNPLGLAAAPYTSVVGSYAANNLGLFDMAGNVWEWCNDWSDLPEYDYYQISPFENPRGPEVSTARVLRGGGWLYGTANDCRVARRGHHPPENCRNFIGFRIVRGFEGCQAPPVQIIDDMEVYTPWTVPGNNIFEIWRDGPGDCTPGNGNDTGSVLTENMDPAYVLDGVQGISHQSMRYDYDNDGLVFNPCLMGLAPVTHLYSKVEAQITDLASGIGPNWNPCGTTRLVLNFFGMPGNGVDEVDPLWVELKDADGNRAKVVYGDRPSEDPQHLTEESWHEWLIDMNEFAYKGVHTTEIASIAIGFGSEGATTPGGSGTLYFDEIHLKTP